MLVKLVFLEGVCSWIGGEGGAPVSEWTVMGRRPEWRDGCVGGRPEWMLGDEWRDEANRTVCIISIAIATQTLAFVALSVAFSIFLPRRILARARRKRENAE